MSAPPLVKPYVPAAFRVSPERAYSLGPLVCDLAADAGFVPDVEQVELVDDVFAYRADHSVAAFEVAVEAPRQNLKTGWEKI